MKDLVNRPIFLIVHLIMVISVAFFLYQDDAPPKYNWAVFSHMWTPFVMLAVTAITYISRFKKAVICGLVPFVCSALYCIYSVFAYTEYPFSLAETCKANIYLSIAISTLAIDVYYNDGFYSDKELEDEIKNHKKVTR